jgi:5-hydroxyisourate hydrolase
MTGITSHVLDTSIGKPAAGIAISLHRKTDRGWSPLGNAVTDDDGRVASLTGDSCEPGHYQITFAVADYFARRDIESFYPVINIEFNVVDAAQHYHVPLLLNPFGFSTYRGS